MFTVPSPLTSRKIPRIEHGLAHAAARTSTASVEFTYPSSFTSPGKTSSRLVKVVIPLLPIVTVTRSARLIGLASVIVYVVPPPPIVTGP